FIISRVNVHAFLKERFHLGGVRVAGCDNEIETGLSRIGICSEGISSFQLDILRLLGLIRVWSIRIELVIAPVGNSPLALPAENCIETVRTIPLFAIDINPYIEFFFFVWVFFAIKRPNPLKVVL